MAGTFSWRPDWGVNTDHTPKANVATMGDGYEQRVAKGINNDMPTMTLNFSKRPITEFDAIYTFLKSHGAHESFTFVNRRGQSFLYVCPNWSEVEDGTETGSIRATFRQVIG